MKNIELVRKEKNVSLVDIADLLGDFTFGETVVIKKTFFPEYELEYLFSEHQTPA